MIVEITAPGLGGISGSIWRMACGPFAPIARSVNLLFLITMFFVLPDFVPEVGVTADRDPAICEAKSQFFNHNITIGCKQKAPGPVVANGAVSDGDIRSTGDVLKGDVGRIYDFAKIEIRSINRSRLL